MKILLLGSMILCAANALAETPPWEYIGPGKIAIGALVPDRNNPNLIFAQVILDQAFSTGTLYRSTDQGQTWNRTSFAKDVDQVLIHPKSSAVLVVTRQNIFPYNRSIWKSTNHGVTFAVV